MTVGLQAHYFHAHAYAAHAARKTLLRPHAGFSLMKINNCHVRDDIRYQYGIIKKKPACKSSEIKRKFEENTIRYICE